MKQRLRDHLFAALTVANIVLIVLALALLAGCATPTAPPTEIVARATTVEPIRIPVVTPCLTKDQIPAPPPTWMRADRGGEYNELAARVDLKSMEDYIVQSQSRMWGCVRGFEETKP